MRNMPIAKLLLVAVGFPGANAQNSSSWSPGSSYAFPRTTASNISLGRTSSFTFSQPPPLTSETLFPPTPTLLTSETLSIPTPTLVASEVFSFPTPPPPAEQSSEPYTRSSNGSISDNPPVTTDKNPTTLATTPGGTSTPRDTTPGTPAPSTTSLPSPPPSMGSTDGPASQNRTLVITLSTVLSAVALFLVVATAFACFRAKHGRLPFVKRGITPIDDEEIESWKRRAGEEKKYTGRPAESTAPTSPARSLKKSPSVIVYQNNTAPTSGEDSDVSAHDGGVHSHSRSHSQSNTHNLTRSHFHSHPYSLQQSHSHSLSHTQSSSSIRPSLDLPPAAILARAPNSRPGLTDETVEGDAAFIPTHRRQGSRLSKKHSRGSSSQWGPCVTPRQSGEGRARSSEVATAKEGNRGREGSRGREGGHARIYSDSSVPPRLSFEEGVVRGLAPAPVRGPGSTPASEIGRAIG